MHAEDGEVYGTAGQLSPIEGSLSGGLFELRNGASLKPVLLYVWPLRTSMLSVQGTVLEVNSMNGTENLSCPLRECDVRDIDATEL